MYQEQNQTEACYSSKITKASICSPILGASVHETDSF